MQVLLGIKDFAKIKSAEVNLGGFSVFVGNNNSGKTYVMQLIYGIQSNLWKYLKDPDLCGTYLDSLEKQADTGRVAIDTASVGILENFYNKVLQKYKKEIVRDTFLEEIEIGQIYVRLLMEENEQFEWLIYKHNDAENKLDKFINLWNDYSQPESVSIMRDIFCENSGLYCSMAKYRILNGKRIMLSQKYCLKKISIGSQIAYSAVDMFADNVHEKNLFLPASRTGLLMLYKEFFAFKTDETVNLLMRPADYDSQENESRKLGITQPVYDFLRFLQTFRQKRNPSKNKEFIDFIENHLIEGKILISQDGQPVYQAQDVQCELPLHLSSSMVNELMPVLYALQSAQEKRYIIWDEIETSLHPQKQMELARLLSRMSNHGFSMAVSTHSDTMAAKINNLCLLSFSQMLGGRKAEILKKAGLEEDDLFKERIHVYQFENDDQGRSMIKELDYDEVTGYQFSLFNDSVEKLFQETKMILE